MPKYLPHILVICLSVLLGGTALAQPSDPPTGDQVVAYARTFLGTPYKLGSLGPRSFDGSSFTR